MVRAKKDFWCYDNDLLMRKLTTFLNLLVYFHSVSPDGKEFLVYAGQQKAKSQRADGEITEDDVVIPTPTFSLTTQETYWELLSDIPLVVKECAELRYLNFKTVLSVTQFVTWVKFKEETVNEWALNEAKAVNEFNSQHFNSFLRTMEERRKILENKDFIRFNLVTRFGTVYPINLPFIGFQKNYMVIDNDSSTADTFNQVGAGLCGVAMPDGKNNKYDNDNYFQLSKTDSALIISDYTPFFSKPFRGYDILRSKVVLNLNPIKQRAAELEKDEDYKPPLETIEDSLNPFVPAFFLGIASGYSPEVGKQNYLVLGMSYAQLFIVSTYDLIGGA